MPAAPLTDAGVARERLEVLIQSSLDPTINTEELIDLMADAQRAELWVLSTAYTLGDVIVPTLVNRSGHRYVCTVSGTSGATEPDWTTGRDSLNDDGTVTWREAGWDYDYVLWDLNAAAAAGWFLKAGKAAADFDFSTDRKDFKRSQIYEHCLEQANRYSVATVA